MPEVVPTQTALRHSLLALAALALAGCPGKTATDGGAPAVLPNICNAMTDAQSEAQCQLTPAAAPVCFYMDHVGKTLWLGLTMPATLSAQSLLTIEAGYDPKGGSPVELSLNVVTAGQASIATGQNLHDPGAPGPINIITTPPTSLAGQQIFLIFSDSSGTHDDVRNQFCVTANVTTDPDPNQAGVPTVVTLAGGANGVETNSPPAPGNLSTQGRVDEFAFSIDSSIARPILYFSITVPTNPDGGTLTPPIAYLMGYKLYDCGPASGAVTSASATACAGNPPTVAPGGSVAATSHMPNVYLPVNLATAIAVKSGDMYVLEVQGFNSNNADTSTPPGDIRVNYALTVETMPDLDSYDGPTPTPVNPSLGGGAVTLSSGRLSYVSQVDSFAINVSGQAVNTRLHYLVTPGATGSGRFPAFPPLSVPPRILTLATPVPASAGADPGQACNDDYNTCPNDIVNENAGSPAIGLPGEFCEMDGGPQCLYSYRQEDPDFAKLGNFEGIIPVKAGTKVMNLAYEWQGSSAADDVPYTLAITWLPEGPENQSSYHWTETTAIPATFPGTYNGAFTIGDTLTDSSIQTVRGNNDYDAVPSTLDVYQFTYSSESSAALYGATWGWQMSIQNSGANGPPLTMEFAPEFCTLQNGTPQCVGQQSGDPFYNLQALFYNNSGGVWYPTNSAQNAWGQTTSGGDTVDTVLPAACFCFQPDYLAAGSFYLYIFGTNRTSYADATYSFTTSMSDYPGSNGDGGLCPSTAPDPDAGIAAVGCGMSPTSCQGSGSQCTSDGDCCSQDCNTTNPCSPGMASGGINQGSSNASCSPPGFGFCD